MQVLIDMETRSEVDLVKCGVYKYAEHSSTEVMCIAFKIDKGITALWVHPKFMHLYDPGVSARQIETIMAKASTIVAHNAEFERVMWDKVMVRDGAAKIPHIKWKCTAAKAAAMALPRSLDGACAALGLSHQKDQEGRRIMLKMCKPRKPTKHNKAKWHEDPDEFKRLCQYCVSDVDAEYELDQALPDLSDDEVKLYWIDQTVNQRGVHVDVESIEKISGKIREKEQDLLAEVERITGGYVTSPRQGARMLQWLEDEAAIQLPDLKKETVEAALTRTRFQISGAPMRLLEIRQSLSKSSVSKLDAMKRSASSTDNRVRGSMLFHAASTGRWGGKLIQPHNYPRASFTEAEIKDIVSWPVDTIEMIYGDMFACASKSLRGMICAAPGNELLCADFSAIEARVLAWIAFEREVLDDFKNGLDNYKVAASKVYNVAYDNVNDDQRFIGKTLELACGYQGWVNAFRAMGDKKIDQMSDEDISRDILAWRGNRSGTVNLWARLNEAAINAVKYPDDFFGYGLINYGMKDGFLHCRLPSGRLLAYYSPRVEMKTDMYDREKETLTFMGVNSLTKKWERQSTYGGKLTENVVQAIARDILAEAIIRCENSGFPVVMHVHDEIISENIVGSKGMHQFENAVSEAPLWAGGLPLKAKGWIGKRYRK